MSEEISMSSPKLIRRQGRIDDRTFEVEFLDRGAEAFAFTFGYSNNPQARGRVDADCGSVRLDTPIQRSIRR
jgi:hypothetical protein